MSAMAWPKELPPLLQGYLDWPEQPPPWLAPLATFSGLLAPTGWVDAVVWHGVVKGQAWGWLFLLPCAALSALALWCRPRLVSLREIRISSQGQLTPVFADDPDPEYSEGAAAIAAPVRNSALPSSPPDRQAAIKRLLDGPPLGKCDWSRGWPLERMLGRLLTERERILLSISGPGPSWTLTYLLALGFSVAWIVLIAAVWAQLSEPEPATKLFALLTMPLVFAAMPCHVAGGRSQHPIFPCGFRETSMAMLKAMVLRLPLILLPLGGMLATACFILRIPLADGLNALAACSGAGFSSVPLIQSFAFAHHTRYEFSVHRALYLAVLTVLLLAGFTMLLSPLWPLTVACAAVTVSLAWGIWFYFDWLYHSGRLDYNDWRPPADKKTARPVR
jgi:hypothetical protein